MSVFFGNLSLPLRSHQLEYTLSSKELSLFDEKSHLSEYNRQWNTNISIFNAIQTLSECLCVIRKVFRLGPYIAPTEYDSSWVLLGETSKFIKMSEQHVSDVMVTSGYLIVQLHGSPQEVITIAAIDTNNNITIANVRYFQCTIPDDREVILHIYPMDGVNFDVTTVVDHFY